MRTLAIIGRPNVGKSTLFNRLTGLQHALVDDTPGVTRDRREGKGSIGPLEFLLVDTAGLEDAKEGSLEARMTAQSLQAMAEADAVLMMIDGRAGITPTDRHFAQLVRKSKRPAVLAVNKTEGKGTDAVLGEAYQLGLGEPIAIAAAHGDGMMELYEALAPHLEVKDQENDQQPTVNDQPLSIAIVGRPNAGKSTLINQLLGHERVLTGPEAGITRDAIAIPFTWQGKALKLVDTAGMRKKANVQDKLEKLAVADTLRAIRYAEVVVLVVDAAQPLDRQDAVIAGLIEQEGRAMVLAVNKWDTVTDEKAWLKAMDEVIARTMPQVKGLPVIPISAMKKKGLKPLMEAVFKTHERWNIRVPTAALNRWLEGMLAAHTPPLIDGRRLKIRYATQAKARPPTFMLSANVSPLPAAYERYLVNGLRETFDLPGVPIRFRVKKSKNPYEKDHD